MTQVQVQVPPPASPPATTVSVHLSHPWLTFAYALCRPKVMVDGAEVASGWGEHVLAVPVAPVELSVYVPYLGMRSGRASFPLTPGGPPALRYRAPYWVLLRGDLGVTARARGAGLMWALVVVGVIVAGWSSIVVWQVMSALDDASADGPTLVDQVSPVPADASSFLLEPIGPGLAPEVVTGTAALLNLRLAGTGGVAEVEGDGVRVTFPKPPPPEVMAHLVDPTVVEFRPVLMVGPPDPIAVDGGGDGSGVPMDPSDADYFLTTAMMAAYGVMDCTNPGTAPFVSPEGAMVACDAAGSSKYALGAVEVTGDMLAEVEAGPRTLPDGGVVIGEVEVTMVLDATGTSAFRDATTRLATLPSPADEFAIVVDGQVVSAPQVNEVIPSGELVLSGSGENDTFTTLVAQLLFGRADSTWQVGAADT